MQQIEPKSSLHQIWFYRYGAICNNACPQIALTRADNNRLVPRHFAASDRQLLNPTIVSAVSETYILETTDDSQMVLSSSIDPELCFEKVETSQCNIWSLASTTSGIVFELLSEAKEIRRKSI